MKVVFLDVDGVLNCKQTHNPRKFPFIVDPALLKRLNRLLENTGAQIVLSSNWRYDPVGLFAAQFYGVRFVDTTPDLPGRARGDAITEWVRAHPNTERFIVIDDEDDQLDGLPLFQPLRHDGLTDEIVARAAAYLNRETEKDMRRNKFVRLCQNFCSFVIGHKG